MTRIQFPYDKSNEMQITYSTCDVDLLTSNYVEALLRDNSESSLYYITYACVYPQSVRNENVGVGMRIG